MAQLLAVENLMIIEASIFRDLGAEGRAMAIKRKASFNPKAFLAKVGEGRSIHAYPEAGRSSFPGESADAVFFLQTGKVKVTVVSKRGKEAVVAILGANEFFGEGCLAGQAQRIATAATITNCVIVRLEKAAILRVIHQEPAFSEMFIAHLLGRTIRVEADLVDQLFNSSEKRLADCEQSSWSDGDKSNVILNIGSLRRELASFPSS